MKKKRNIMALIAAITLLIGTALPVQAAGGWWIDSENVGAEIYGGTGEETLDSIDLSEIEEGNVNAFEAILGDIVYWIGKGLDTVVNRSGDVKLGIDNVVLGRMASGGGDISYMQFGLETGNPWGIIGARIFVAIRSVIYGAFLLYVQVTLIMQMLKGGGKGRAETKEVIQNAFFCFLMIYAIPFLTQAILYFRDVLMYLVINKIGGGAGTTAGILGTFEAVFLAHKSILNALFYLATTLAGLWFLSNYIGNALIQAGLFGAAPFVLLRSIKNKRLFTQWFNTFTINMAIPLIDAAFLMIPSVLGKILQDNGVSSMNFAFMLVRLFLIFSIIPARNGVLRLLSESTGGGLMPAGGGMGALGAMAARAAMRAVRRGDGGGLGDHSSLHSEDPDHDRAEADTLLSNSDSITAAQHDVLNQVPNIDDLLYQNGGGSVGSESLFDQERASAELDSICGSIPDSADISPEITESAIDDTITAASAVPEYRDPGAVEQEPDMSERISGAIPDEIGSSGSVPEIEEIGIDSPETITPGELSDFADLQSAAAAQTAATPAMDRGGVPAHSAQERRESPDRLYGNTQFDQLSNMVQDRDETAQARFENLQKIETCGAAMTANDRKIQELSLQEASLDRQIASARMDGGSSMASDLEDAEVRKADYQNDMRSAHADMKQFKAEGAAMRQQLADHESGKAVMSREEVQQTKQAEQRARQHYAAAAERYEAAKENYNDADNEIRQIQSGSRTRVTDLQEQRAAVHERKVALQQHNQTLQGAQAAYKKAEMEYADLDKAKGGSGQKFNSAAVYKETAESQARRAKLANVLNFDSSKFNGVLTPEERAERLRDRALLGDRRARIAEIRRKTEVPRKIASGLAGAAVGVAVTAYGGDRNAAMGAMLGMEGADLLTSGRAEPAPRTEEKVEEIFRKEKQRIEYLDKFRNIVQ